MGNDAMDVTSYWYWEGNVVETVAGYLARQGWRILNRADLLVEAKGYPSKQYCDPRRAGEQKPANPTNQAQQWYSHVLLKALRL
jgi:hypothetical protein